MQAPWTAHTMVNESGKPMSPDDMADYVKAAMVASALESCEDRFWFVSMPHPDGGAADLCHVGNGPNSEKHARLIAAAPDLLAIVREVAEFYEDTDAPIGEAARAALAKAELAKEGDDG